MLETPQIEHGSTFIPPESSDELLHKLEKDAKVRNIKSDGKDFVGVDKATQEWEARLNQTVENDKQDGVHMEAGTPLPIRARDNKHAAELIEQMINRADKDPFDEINMLSDQIEN